MTQAFCTVALIALAASAQAQTAEPQPRIVTRPDMATQVTTVEVGAHFVTAIRLPEAISSVAVGDPALFDVESNWNPYAVSPRGAVGLMQLMPRTAFKFGVRNRFQVEDNVRGGVAYLAWLIQLFRGDLRLVMGAYVAGQDRMLSRGLAYSSREVYEYVSNVARQYRRRRTRTIRGGKS